MSDRTTIKDHYTKVKAHVIENKTTYLACAGTAVVTVVGTILILSKQEEDVENVAKAIGWKPRAEFNQVTVYLEERSTPSRPVHLVGTDRYFASLSEAARETGHTVSAISQQINGHRDHVSGDVFELLEPTV